MNKIRLTESQLHRVIKETVKRILEDYGMDWRTAANAAQQSANADPQRIAQYDAKHGQGAWNERGNRFSRYAHGSFNTNNMKSSNPSFGNYAEYCMSNSNFNSKNPSAYMNQNDSSNGQNGYFDRNMTTHIEKGKTPMQNMKYRKNMWDNEQEANRQGINSYQSNNQYVNQAAQRGNQQISDYMNGNSRYVKGQGWQ
jgi:hypothetical protein